MSEQLGKLTFLPWYRIGIANNLITSQRAGNETHAQFEVKLDFTEENHEKREASIRLALYGPGEVEGIDPRVILRTYPEPNAGNVEPNYFPFVEFDQPDFPWRYTPEAPTQETTTSETPTPEAPDRLPPWLCLIVLDETEIFAFPATGEGSRGNQAGQLPILKVQNQFLPDLDQSWAWAHVQISARGDAEPASEKTILDIIEKEPERVLSRLMCPRYLTPRKRYTAFLVPAYERGRKAGLKETLDAHDTEPIPAIEKSWSKTDSQPLDEVVLPVYYHWSFQVGLEGDFESLVKKLINPPPKDLPDTVGRRDIDLSAPGLGLPAATPNPLTLEGALVSPASRKAQIARWDTTEQAIFFGELQKVVNTPVAVIQLGNQTIKVVAPPLYGRWHAAINSLRGLPIPDHWFHQLNSAPPLRVIAGLGTLVVQEQQEQLMASAWDQVEGTLAINKYLVEAQAACVVSNRLYERDFLALDQDTLIEMTRPLHSKITNSPTTIKARISQSPISSTVLEAPYRRLVRTSGIIRKRIRRLGQIYPRDYLRRMNQGMYRTVAPKRAYFLRTWGRLTRHLQPDGVVPKQFQKWFIRSLSAGSLSSIALAAGLITKIVWIQGIGSFTLGLSALVFTYQFRQYQRLQTYKNSVRKGTLNADTIKKTPIPLNARPSERSRSKPPVKKPGLFGKIQEAAVNRKSMQRFKSTIARHFESPRLSPSTGLETGGFNTAGMANGNVNPIDLDEIHKSIIDQIKPEVNLKNLIKGRIQVAPWTGWNIDERHCEPVMAAPTFNQPMYEAVRDLSVEWLLPGVGNIKQNTVSLLVTNKDFVESFMVGLNHEMARELLWREYPTDQRGTCFRQFWDVRGYVDNDPTASEMTEASNWIGQQGINMNSLNEVERKEIFERAFEAVRDQRAIKWLQEKNIKFDELSNEEKPLALKFARDEIFKNKVNDIIPITDWKKELGGHHREDMIPVNTNEENIVFLIRGELLQRYPNAIIYAQKAETQNGQRVKSPGVENQKYPIFKGTIKPDIYFLGFRLVPSQVLGVENDPSGDQGYFFVIEENPTGARFGLDAPDKVKDFGGWGNLAWQGVFPADIDWDKDAPYIDLTNFPPPIPSTAAHFAHITFQPPFRALVHGSDMLPPKNS